MSIPKNINLQKVRFPYTNSNYTATMTPVTNEELIEAHNLDEQRRGLMESSIGRRDQCLRAFSRSIGDRSLLEVDRRTIEKFLDGRHSRTGSKATMSTRSVWLAHLSEFYKWAIRDDLTEVNPTAKIVRPHSQPGLPRPADTEDLFIALSAAGRMHRCWVLLAAFQGMRCQEIAGLKVDDVFARKGKIRVTKGKGGKQRMLPLHPEVLEALKALPMPRDGYVFLRPRGTPYPPEVLSSQFNKFLRSAIPDHKVTAHQLRHWFATEFYAETHDLRLTSEVMGHADTSTTQVYTKVDVGMATAPLQSLTLNPKETP